MAKRFKRERRTDSYAYVGGYSGERTNAYTRYGSVGTPHGFVRVYAWDAEHGAEGHGGYLLEFIRDGRTYREWNNYQTLTERGLVTKARRFAERVATQAPAGAGRGARG